MVTLAEAGRNRTVRSALIRADLARDAGKEKDAIPLYEKVAKEVPALLVDIIPRLAACHAAVGQEANFSGYLQRLLEADAENVAAIAMAAVRNSEIDDPIALEALRRFVTGDATLAGLIDIEHLERSNEPGRREILDRVRATLQNVVSRTPGYRCEQCGYVSLILHWQCPGCRSWESVKPGNRINLVSST